MASQIRHNYHEDCEPINKQINLEFYASYVYMSMGHYFDRDDISLPGASKFFKDSSDEEREHGQKLMKYQNKRGARIVLQAIAAPSLQEWGNLHDALQAALDLENEVNQSLLDLDATASKINDPHLTNMLEGEFLEEQVESIEKIGNLITRLKRAGTSGLGEFLFDKELKQRFLPSLTSHPN
uniref:Ferritin n=1 Tax=Pacifastacus leniusculus TaxID=6720 RepID=FRI_PACLE|nr:RecName: Full=Ferritin [Pacifastacus leniusculus]CAA62186.1 ferritin [Pacifastacus leniusculus]prf//2207210A ferritin [Pacifastacus leniusculus]